MENRASQRAMEKILKGEKKKRSRMRFIFINVALWSFGVMSIFAGAVVVSVIIFTLVNGDMDLHREIYGCMFPRVTFVMIGVWVLLTGFFVILCDMFVRHTNRGYVYPLWVIVISNIFLSTIFGMIFYQIGISYDVDRVLGDHMRYYYNVDKRRATLYNVPDKGIVMGRVVSYEPTHVLMMLPNRELMTVAIGHLDDRAKIALMRSEQAVFLGRINEEGVFVACDLRTRQLSGVRQTIKDHLYTEIDIDRIAEQRDQIIERVRMTTYQIPHICNEQVHWRIVAE